MKLSDYEKQPGNRDKSEGDAKVKCNALYKSRKTFNAKLTPIEAIELAKGLLMKAQTILADNLEDAAVHLWNRGESSEVLRCGIDPPRKGPRTRRRRSKPR